MNLFDAYVWIRANWKSLGWPVAVVFCFLWWNKTTPCPEAPVTVTQAQTSKSDCYGKIKYIPQPYPVEVPGEMPKPLPCPALEIDFGAGQAHWQSQSVTVTPAINSRTPVGLFVGAGFVGQPVIQGGAFLGPWRVSAVGNLGTVGALGSYDLRF